MASGKSSAPVRSVMYPRPSKSHRERGGQRRKDFTPRKRASESEQDGVCDLCVQKIKIYAIGHCNHPICYRCSAKMRVLCEQQDCAVCRVELKKVIYSKSYEIFDEVNARQLIPFRKYNVFFTEKIIKDDYEKLFEHPCPVCPDHHLEISFEKLEAHMRKEHKLFYCNLCVRFNTNFTDECKTYTRETLARHRRVGDDDDSSHKGHPLCEFCDERYLDKDALLHHLRKDHYFCHFCDQDGSNQYYDGYVDLRKHYRKDHFLCEEGDCINEKFTSVFGSELDLKAHRAAAHKDGLSRQQQKVERNIDLGFQYPKPSRGGRGRGNRNDGTSGEASRGRGRGRGDTRNGKSSRDEDLELAKAISLSEQENAKRESAGKNQDGKRDKPRVQREQPKQQQPQREPTPPPDLVNDFPTLGALGVNQQQNDPYSYTSVRKTAQKPEEKSEPEELKPQQSQTTAERVAAAAGRSIGKITPEDFPSLGANKPTSAATGIWGSVYNTTSKPQKSSLSGTKKSANLNKPGNAAISTADWKSKEDFPTLGGKPITVPPPASQPPPQVKKPVSVNMPQSKFTKSNVDFKNKDEFPTLGGSGSNGSALNTVWGQGATVPIVSSKRSKKTKTPITNQEAPKKKPQLTATKTTPFSKDHAPVQPPPVTRDVNPMSQDETVSIRIGSHKHTMRLTSTKYSDTIEGIEKPVEVPGVGGSSVKTVSADTFSLLSNQRPSVPPWAQSNEGKAKFRSQGEDFPELGGGKGGKIKGIGNSKSSKLLSHSYNMSGEPDSGISLSTLSREMVSKCTTENVQETPPDLLSNRDFPSVLSKPPPLSSYAPDWYDDTPANLTVGKDVKMEMNFQSQDGDFPTLPSGTSYNAQNPNKKNKRKKKKGQPSVNDLSRHFGTDPSTSSQNTGLLENLLQSQKQNEMKSISDMLDQNKMFEPTKTNEISAKKTQKQANGVRQDVTREKNGATNSEVRLDPRPDDDDIEGRNIWLINTVQQLCGTEENFTEFKISSGQFRQGALSAEKYYGKCKILLGLRYFDTVFRELVDLLPDVEKQKALLCIHQAR